jgi:hypothetical protein
LEWPGNEYTKVCLVGGRPGFVDDGGAAARDAPMNAAPRGLAALLAPLFWDSTLTLAAAMVAFLLLGLTAFALRQQSPLVSRK